MSRFKAAISTNFAPPSAPRLVKALSPSAVDLLAAPAKPKAVETTKLTINAVATARGLTQA